MKNWNSRIMRQLYAEEMNRSGMTHGEYNYHNIIMTKEGIATMNFEKFHQGYSGGGSVLFSPQEKYWRKAGGSSASVMAC